MISPAAYIALALACGVAQLAVLLKLNAHPRRISDLKSEPDDETPRRPALSFERLGRRLIRLARRQHWDRNADADARTATSVGAAAVFAACLLPLGPLATAAGGFAGWAAPRFIERRSLKARTAAFVSDLPEVVDLLALALGAGLNVLLAVDAVGRRGTGPLAAELALAAEATRRGQRLADALDDVSARCGDQVRPLMSLLASGERYGVPLGESLDRLAIDVRGVRRRQAEEVARRLPVKMLFPLVVCILPAFALLTLGPLLLTSFGDLAW